LEVSRTTTDGAPRPSRVTDVCLVRSAPFGARIQATVSDEDVSATSIHTPAISGGRGPNENQLPDPDAQAAVSTNASEATSGREFFTRSPGRAKRQAASSSRGLQGEQNVRPPVLHAISRARETSRR